MKTNELKINDIIEYTNIYSKKTKGIIKGTNCGIDTKHFLVSVIGLSNTIEYVPYNRVISKLETLYKEIPIEHVFNPVSFDINIFSIGYKHAEYGMFNAAYNQPCTIMSGEGTGNCIDLKLAALIPFNVSKKYKVTIEEIV